VAIARGLAQSSARVVLAGPDTAAGTAAVQQLRAEQRMASYELLEPRQAVQHAALATRTIEAHGRLDVWVNVASAGASGPAEFLTSEAWEQGLAGSLSAAFFGAQAAAHHMLAQGRGVILNVSNTGAYAASAGLAAASAAHAGLIMLTQALGVEWAARGVRVVGLATGMTPDSDTVAALRRVPLRRPADPSEVAAAAVFLASDGASYIVGETLPVDGGWRAYQLF
jgi:NAD(P)-dependent dehydrogenase (short-subunit alcohol dehydrogenase family)